MAEPVRDPVGAPHRGSSISGFSIEFKLPLSIFALVLTISAAYTWASYRNVKLSALTAARDRLRSITDQLGTMLQGSAKQLMDSLHASKSNEAVRRYLATQTADAKPAALAALTGFGPQLSQVLSTELWNARRERLLAASRDSSPRVVALNPENVHWAPGPDSGAVGRLQAIGDSLVYPVTEQLTENGRVLGWVVQ